MSQEKEHNIGEELFIEELAEIRGGIIKLPIEGFTTLALGEEGVHPNPHDPHVRKPIWPGKKRPEMSTMALGEEGTTVPVIRPLSDV